MTRNIVYIAAIMLVPYQLWATELTEDARCIHGGQMVPIVLPVMSTCPTPTVSSLIVSSTQTIPPTSTATTVTVPGPSAMYTSLTISGTLFANQLCTSQVNAANVNTLFMQSGYYAKGQAYQILRSNSSIAATIGNELIITSTDGTAGNKFGTSVAMSGNGGSIAVVGAPRARGTQGVVYIYQRQTSNWALFQEILDPAATGGDNFGEFVAISYDGSTIAVASNATFNGSVLLYQFNATTNQYTLSQTLVGTSAQFGASISLSATGQYVAIANNTTPPQVYIYVRNDSCAGIASSWTLQQTITAIFRGEATPPSVSLSADATTLAVGIPDATGADTFGMVEMYVNNAGVWTLVQSLVSSDGAAGDSFGQAVALSSNGQYLLVGSPFHAAGAGEAYEFVLRGTFWNQENIFLPPNGVLGFGSAVSISADGTVGVIGAPNSADGSAFVVLRSPDNMWTTPFNYTGHVTPNFGNSVSVSADGGYVIVGAPDASLVTAGSASIFRPIGATIPADTIITGSLCVYGNMTVDADLLVTGSIFVNGSVITQAVTACVAPSDVSRKKNIKPLDVRVALERLSKLEPVTFEWVNPEEHAHESNPSAGFVAQDVEQHFPRWIYHFPARGKDANCVPRGAMLRYIGLTPELYAYVVRAIQGIDDICTRNTKAIELLQKQ